MEWNSILAGGFIGVVIQQIFIYLNSRQSFKQDKLKMYYQNKLSKGEVILGYYVSIYYNLRTILSSMDKYITLINNTDDVDKIDGQAVDKTYEQAHNNVVEIEKKIMDHGTTAYLYYDINNSWTDIDADEMYHLSHEIKPKMLKFVELDGDIDTYLGEEYLAVQKDLIENLTKLRQNFERYKNAVDSTIKQLKKQAKE